MASTTVTKRTEPLCGHGRDGDEAWANKRYDEGVEIGQSEGRMLADPDAVLADAERRVADQASCLPVRAWWNGYAAGVRSVL